MDAVPALPPYAHLTQEAVQCVAQASVRYDVPELLLHSILMKENGRTGKCSRNKDGTMDCGLAQINSLWLLDFAKKGVRPEYIVHDACTNIHAGAYVLRYNYNLKRDWFQAIVSYNIGPYRWTPERYGVGYRYASEVVRWWWGFQNWVDAKTGVKRATVPAYAQPARAPKQSGQILEFSSESEAAVDGAPQ